MNIKKVLVLILIAGILLLAFGCANKDKKPEETLMQNDEKLVDDVIFNIKNELAKGIGYINADIFENNLEYDMKSRIIYIDDTRYERKYFIKNNTICYNDYELTDLQRKYIINPNDLTFEEEIMLDAYVSDEEIARRTSSDTVIYEGKGKIKEETMTIINKKIYFAEYLNNKYYIKIYNVEDKNVKELCALENDISDLTYISDDCICYLKDKNIYAYLIEEDKEIRINVVDNIEKFFVCKYGILYSVTDENGEKIYANNELILESTQDMAYKAENNFYVVDENDKPYQIGIAIREKNKLEKSIIDSGDITEEYVDKYIYAERLFNNFNAEKDILDSFYE